jgi:putrescine transport system substrate-binding protein
LRDLLRRLAVVTGLVLAMPGVAPSVWAADRAHTLNIYAWADYFPQDLIDQFEHETGIHVNSAVFDSPETAETILSVGHSGYDIVTMNASPELARELPKGFWRKLDFASIPNAHNADPDIMRRLASVDAGNQYAIPWMWGTTGIVYNAAKIKALMPNAPTDSLDMVLKKDVAAKFSACGISLLDSWADIMPMVAHYLGQSELSADPAKLDAVVAKLREIRPLIRRVASSGYYEQLADGELCLALGYSGDAMIARRMVKESNTKIVVDYAFPREYVPFYIDSLVIPADSPNAAAAQQFINFVLRPDVAAGVTRYIGFASGNAAAIALLPAEVRDNPIVYPKSDVRRRFALERVYSNAEIRSFTRAWQQFKTGT